MIAIAGILPSTFITIRTIGILGLKKGLIILIVGEAIESIASFILYRKGFITAVVLAQNQQMENRLLERLKNMNGQEVFFYGHSFTYIALRAF